MRRWIQDLLGLEADPDINPLTAVAEGAAIAAAIVTGKLPESDFFVCLEHSLGTFTYDIDSDTREFSTIIRKGTKLPARSIGEYFPISSTTDSVTIRVVEGDPESRAPDFTVLKEWDVTLPLTSEQNHSRLFELHYEYDIDGILKVKVRDSHSGLILLEDDVSYGIGKDRRQMKQMSDRAQSAVETGKLGIGTEVQLEDPESAKLLNQALTKVIPFLDNQESQPIQEAVEKLATSHSSNSEALKNELKRLLAPYSYLF